MDPITKGLIFLIATWILFAVAVPAAKRFMVIRWELMQEEQCRRQLRKLWNILFYSHVAVIIVSFFFFSRAQSVRGFADKYLDYLFVLYAVCIVLQFVFTAVKEHTTDKFGVDPKTPLWWKVMGPAFRLYGRVVDYIISSIKMIFKR